VYVAVHAMAVSSDPDRQRAALAAIRKLSSSQYITAATLESFAAAIVISPAMFLWYTIEGAITARYPRPVAGAPAPPIPQ
jgi:hypothetical protein